MANASPLVFNGITPAQYEVLIQKARAAGIEMTGNHGRANRIGIEVEWSYVPEEEKLTLTCLHTPFFISTEDVNFRLRAVVSESLQA